ncbi:hypothetical protein CFP56_028551 [Quercus suber]|uniref:F-box protein At3g26010-like beta-propeller domain-containing protein n=1 Tax=Quercus suber TaxID=58331 RepID=A0AAW0JUC9_QUESU
MTCSYVVQTCSVILVFTLYYVINPITRQWTALPPLPELRNAQYGFMCWYDVHHRLLSYWVMRNPGVVGKSTEFKVDIFSSETGKWSQFASVCPTDCHVGFNPYTSKCCQFFEKPVDLNRSYGIFERLGVFHGGKWYLKHKVYLRDLEKSPCLTELLRVDPIVEVLAYHPNDGEIMYLMIETKVVSCNLRRKTLEVVLDSLETNDLYSDYNVFTLLLPFWPTLIPYQMEKAA